MRDLRERLAILQLANAITQLFRHFSLFLIKRFGHGYHHLREQVASGIALA